MHPSAGLGVKDYTHALSGQQQYGKPGSHWLVHGCLYNPIGNVPLLF